MDVNKFSLIYESNVINTEKYFTKVNCLSKYPLHDTNIITTTEPVQHIAWRNLQIASLLLTIRKAHDTRDPA